MEFTRLISKADDTSANAKTKKKFYISKPQRARLIKQWKESNLSKAVFCNENKLKVQTFSRWLKQEDIRACQFSEPVSDNLLLNNNQHLDISLPNGTLLNLSGSLEKDWLFSLIQRLCACKYT